MEIIISNVFNILYYEMFLCCAVIGLFMSCIFVVYKYLLSSYICTQLYTRQKTSEDGDMLFDYSAHVYVVRLIIKLWYV